MRQDSKQGYRRNNKQGYRRNRMIVSAVLLILLSIFFLPENTNAAPEDRTTVRVGFYPVSNYQEVKEDGSFSGFSYDYYIQIQKYTR